MEEAGNNPSLVESATEIGGFADATAGVSRLVEAFLLLASPWLQSAGDTSTSEVVDAKDGLVPTTVVAELAYGLDQVVSSYLDDQGLDVEAYGRVQQQVLMDLAEDLPPPAEGGADPSLLDENGQYDMYAVLEAYGNIQAESDSEIAVES